MLFYARLGHLVEQVLSPTLLVADRIAESDLPRPGIKTRAFLFLQRTCDFVLLLPFCGLVVFIMRFVAKYRIEEMDRLRAEFLELTQEKKPLLIAMNHLTCIDSAIMMWAFANNWTYFTSIRRMTWNLPAGDFFRKHLLFRIVAFLSKCIFIHRDGSKEHKNQILGTCHYLLSKGEVVTIFPEGRRSRSGYFDTEKLALGTGRLLAALPGCRVLCVYMRSDRQKHMAYYPPQHSNFRIFKKVLTPKTDKIGREAHFDFTRQVGETLQGLETEYFESMGIVPDRSPGYKRYALITGASEGIGRALALKFAASAYDLILVARDLVRLEELAAECSGKYGCVVKVFAADLSRPEAVSGLISQFRTQGLNVEALVNNAGFGVHGEFESTDVEKEMSLVNLQIQTMLQLTKWAVPHMKAAGQGHIMNVASVYAYSPVPRQSVYSACKSFMASFSQSLSGELEGDNIKISLLCPGVTRTEFRKRAGIREKQKPSGMSAEQVAKAGYKGLMKGTRVVIPGRWNRVFVGAMRHLPDQAALGLMQIINRKRGVDAH